MLRLKERAMKIIEMFDLKLSKEQEEYLKAFRWLCGGPLRTGRSYLLAVCFLEIAVLNPDQWIHPFDHVANDVHQRNIMDTIRRIVPQSFVKVFEFKSGSFRMLSTKKEWKKPDQMGRKSFSKKRNND